MKKLFTAIAAAFICATASATGAGGVVSGTDVNSSTASTAAASNAGNIQAFNPTLMFNEAAGNPFQAQEIHYSGSQTIRTAPSIVAPGLTATAATCLGSVSGGVSIIGGGGTVATTVKDEPCNGREGAKLYHVMGHHDAAIERLCLVSEERAAVEAGFLKARSRWVTGAQRAHAEGKPLPTLQAVPRCKIDQDAEDANRALDAINGRPVSTSTAVPAGTLDAAGVLRPGDSSRAR